MAVGGSFLPHAAASQLPHSAAGGNVAVTQYRNGNAHTGQYTHETILNQSDVTVSKFGKRVSYPVDGQMYAQPVYVPHLTIRGKVRNVVFAATENDTVYAFNADATKTIAPLWETSLLPAGAAAVPGPCGDLLPVVGITSTPVIDLKTQTMFVVTYDLEHGIDVYRLHALNIVTGKDRSSPIVIRGSAPGTGAGSSNGRITFNAQLERQRDALVLANGQVYIAFSSFCDIGNYHGFIFSYSYSGSAFTRVKIYDDTPNGSQGGIWGSGGALAANSTGTLYYMSGNGTFDANTGGKDMGDSFVQLNASLQRTEYFTPFNQLCLAQGDVDLGSGDPLVLQSANVLIGAGKEGRPYVVSTAHMGGYTSDPQLQCGTSSADVTNIDKVQQELPPGTVAPCFMTPGYWNGGASGQSVYFTGQGSPTQAFAWSNGKLSAKPTSTTSDANGGDPIVSSDGTTAGTAVLWVLDGGAVLHAYDPANLSKEFWNSNQDPSRDGVSGYVKFTSPVVAHGRVFTGLSSSLAIFGLLPK
ncbi:MAG TPA: hypothetical protein VGS19_09310 [Streptosporangiaceae bacterium]|nr:hypothetical protein [Streptosporangiaceae bacterium]